MEFHIRRDVREDYVLDQALFSLRGNVILADLRQVRELTAKFNAKLSRSESPSQGESPSRSKSPVKAGQLYAMGLIDEILHYVVALYREQVRPDAFETALGRLAANLGGGETAGLLTVFSRQFPPQQVYAGNVTVDNYLAGSEGSESCRALSLEETMLLDLANLNPAFKPFRFLFDDTDLAKKTIYPEAMKELRSHFKDLPPFGPGGLSLWEMLRAPALASPNSLSGQLEYMRKNWGLLIGKFMARLLMGLDVIKEEDKAFFFGPGPSEAYTYDGLDEYERFSPDQDWMPRTVLMAKSTLVWLYQLSQKYGREILRLDQIPDEELDELARRGFTGLWLIGLWERSNASKTIKQWTGNPEAAASAYSLHDYDIAGELGGWGGLTNLRERCARRGIHLGSDMVPNHTGIDSRWVMEHPDRFLQLRYPPFPGYTFNGGNLSSREGITVQIEDHYYNRTDAAVVFKRIDHRTGDVRYIYHGNDGTSMPWNDTAQIDFLNPEAREAVIRTIVGVCQQFSIVRFDAAMTLAKRHIQRLWYPEPGRGGDIASRSEHAISNDEFNRRIPNEFWREVVDRCAAEAPNTLLLAEAFWMMEGYFVRTLGMHRVYNSAFMNMLKNEENAKYRATIRNTLEFDPEILKRFVNFMNNPDEETAAAQFGRGDKYFGVCTLLVTMPGLPMFGHGQIEGFEEKYGMEYRRSYRDEKPDQSLVDRHEREIFPLMKRRALFSGSAGFRLYDVSSGGSVNENVFAYSNRLWDDRALVLYNNSFQQASGWIHRSSGAIPQGNGTVRRDSLSEALSIHGEGRYFTLLREQRSGLWFIRSSKEISEQGLFVSLNGYEAQVFLDIHEAEDINGRWARLNHELHGRGTPDLEAAIMDIYLGELYAPLMDIFQPERIQKLRRLCRREGAEENAGAAAGEAGKPESAFAFLEEPARAFIAASVKYLDGAGYDPFVPEGAYAGAGTEQIWEEFEAYLGRMVLAASIPAAFTPSPGEADKEALPLDQNEAAAFALGYGILSLLRLVIGEGASGAEAAALADHWKMDRKLREAFDGLGVSGGGQVTELMKAVLARTSPRDISPYSADTSGPGADGLAQTLILENYNADDFRRLLGVNLFDDAVWFNREAFEQVLRYAPLFLILESGRAFRAAAPVKKTSKGKKAKPGPISADDTDAWRARLKRIAGLAEQFYKAEAASGYRLDRFIEALEPGASANASAKGPAERRAAGKRK
jgi:glycosidase